MTNEEIVKLIQQGREDLFLTLWEQTKGFVAKLAYSRLQYGRRGFDGRYCPGSAEIEDLIQGGYIALTEAVKTYRPGNAGFLTWLKFYLLTAFDKAQGIRTSKRDPLDECISLNRPVTEDGDVRIGDRIEADDCFTDVIEQIYNVELQAALDKALSEIPERQAEVIRKTAYEGRTLKECGKDIGISIERARHLRAEGLAKLRYNRGLRAFLSDEMNYYFNVSKERFNTTHQSATELLALRRMDLEEKYSALMRK